MMRWSFLASHGNRPISGFGGFCGRNFDNWFAFWGISELIQDGVNGVLVRNPTPEDWAKAIKAQSERNTPKMESTKNVRTMKEVAQSMERKYKKLLNNCSVL